MSSSAASNQLVPQRGAMSLAPLAEVIVTPPFDKYA
jgi:hypothetical protein